MKKMCAGIIRNNSPNNFGPESFWYKYYFRFLVKELKAGKFKLYFVKKEVLSKPYERSYVFQEGFQSPTAGGYKVILNFLDSALTDPTVCRSN